MDAKQFEQIDTKLTLLEKRKILYKKNIYIGSSDYTAMYVIHWLNKKGYAVKGVFSLEEDECGQTLMGHKIHKMEDLLIPYKKENLVLLSEYYDEKFNRRMDVLGYFDFVQRYVVTVQEGPSGGFILKRAKFAIEKLKTRHLLVGLTMLYKGQKVYSDLRKRIPRKDQILLFPHASLGDIYILGMYKKRKNIIFQKANTLVVIGATCKKAALTAGFCKVVSISQEEMNCVVRLYEVYGGMLPQITILHYQYTFAGIAADLSNAGNINFLQNYEYLVFKQPLEQMYKPKENKEAVLDFCRKSSIVKGRTVILSPYAKSISSVSITFWESLAKILLSQGFCVMTNCAGKYELPIDGTQAICFPLDIANGAAAYAGYFVGLRSGLCEWICCSDCNKVIIYPKQVEANMSLKEYYTFRHVVSRGDLQEYECSMTAKKEDAKRAAALLQPK